jgi:lipopolysaccharide biosynthesis protein
VKTAVVLHLFYPEQWPQFLALWERVWPDVDLFVTVSGPEAGRAKALVQCSAPKARVFEVPNRGRDVAAFLRVLPVLLQEGYVCACKLHTKRSDYADSDGLGWRLDLWQGLLCGGEETERLRALFAANSAIGLLGLNDYWVSVQNYRDSHHERVRELAQRLMPEQREDDWHFFAGTMFWFRPQALSPLLELGLDIEAFEPEHGQREGTLAHAIERVVALAARAGGHMVSLFTPGRPPMHLPVAFARNTTEQLFDELRQIRDRLSATESALTEAQKLALARMEEVQILDAALSQTQKLALERQQIIEAFQQSLPGRAYQLLRRTKQ